MPRAPTILRRELIDMRLRLLFAVWLIYGSPAAGQGTSKALVRFFNDSAKAANFYVDGQFGCSIQQAPKRTMHTVKLKLPQQTRSKRKGTKLPSQSCELHAIGQDGRTRVLRHIYQ
jgi:hypothetical protein